MQCSGERVEGTAFTLGDDLHDTTEVAGSADQTETTRQPPHEWPKADALHDTANLDPIRRNVTRSPRAPVRVGSCPTWFERSEPVSFGHAADRTDRRFER